VQVLFGMTSKMLYIAGMKTESEFADVYLDLLENVAFHLHSEEMMRNMR
jgi:hypothetical protein